MFLFSSAFKIPESINTTAQTPHGTFIHELIPHHWPLREEQALFIIGTITKPQEIRC